MIKRIALAAVVAALSGCGAGDNTGAAATSTAGHLTASAVPAFSALDVNPATASATVPGGVSRVLTLDATVKRIADFAGVTQIHVQLADTSVFDEAYVTLGASDTALVALYTSDKLTRGSSYKGSVVLRLCKDEACTQQFPGSPVQIPYAIEVGFGQ
jgi:hypothetical protein